MSRGELSMGLALGSSLLCDVSPVSCGGGWGGRAHKPCSPCSTFYSVELHLKISGAD